MLGLFVLVSASQVELELCPGACSRAGECHEFFEKDHTLNNTLVPVYYCECFEGFRGTNCNECATHRFGKSCQKCPIVGDRVCGHGLCDEGKTGTGECLCEEGYTKESICTEKSNFMEYWPKVASAVGLLLGASVLVILCVYGLIKFPWHCLPDSVASIALGLMIGFTYLYVDPDADLSVALFFDPETFFLLIIPPIMYDAGYSSDKQYFFRNVGTIMTFAILGTLVSTFLFGFLVYAVCNIFDFYQITLLEAMLFGSLISAVDPVATIAIFEAIKIEKTLHAIVFGESVLNDAISIALFHTFSDFARLGQELDWFSIGYKFLYLFFGSILVAVTVGLVSALLFKWVKLSDHPTLETAMFFLWSYIPFVLCEGIGMSGILALLVLGMVMGHYTHFSLSQESKITTHQTFRTFAFVAENFCFVYLGISIPLSTRGIVWPVILSSIAILIVTRGIVVFSLSPICNFFRTKKISAKNQTIIWLSSMRGAVAFSLALSMPTKEPDVIISSTQYIVLFTIVVLGLLSYPLLRCLKIQSQDIVMTRHGDSVHKPPEGPEGSENFSEKHAVSFFDKVEEFEKEYLQPCFRRVEAEQRLE